MIQDVGDGAPVWALQASCGPQDVALKEVYR